MFILTELTPNPDAMKFLPHRRLTEGATWSFVRGEAAAHSPLALRLLELGSVRQVYIAEDFVTVTREPDGESWSTLKIQVIAALADHLSSGEPAVAGPEIEPSEPEDQIEAEIRQVLGLYVRPGVARDGGEILFERFDPADGVLWIRMQGACGGCPSSRLTLKAGVETIVRRYVPEVRRVEEAVTEPSGEERSAGPVRRWIEKLKAARPDPKRRPVFTHNGQALGREADEA